MCRRLTRRCADGGYCRATAGGGGDRRRTRHRCSDLPATGGGRIRGRGQLLVQCSECAGGRGQDRRRRWPSGRDSGRCVRRDAGRAADCGGDGRTRGADRVGEQRRHEPGRGGPQAVPAGLGPRDRGEPKRRLLLHACGATRDVREWLGASHFRQQPGRRATAVPGYERIRRREGGPGRDDPVTRARGGSEGHHRQHRDARFRGNRDHRLRRRERSGNPCRPLAAHSRRIRRCHRVVPRR